MKSNSGKGLRLVSWNCQSGFQKKLSVLEALKPDVAVIQEVTEKALELLALGNRTMWEGAKGKKGLAVILFNDFKFLKPKKYHVRHQYFLPTKISNGKVDLELIGVWTKGLKDSHENGYVGQAHNFMADNPRAFSAKTMFVGDFNANPIWDGLYRKKTFSALVSALDACDIRSAYHHVTGDTHGKERQPTLYMYRHFHDKTKAYHIDYCFAGSHWLKRLEKVQVPNGEKWKSVSDHFPLVCDFR